MQRTSLAALIICLLLITIIFGTAGCADSREVTLNVSAGAGLIDALTEINQLYMQQNLNVTILSTFAAAGDLRVQIENGAPADIFFSPSGGHMDTLEEQMLLEPGTRRNIVRNSLVLITPAENELSLTSFTDLMDMKVERIAMGDPRFVPSGTYGLQTLQLLGISYTALQPKLILANNVRQVLSYVESRNVDAGIVYATDALASDSVKVISEAPDAINETIIFPAAVIATSSNIEEAIKYLEYLSGAEAGAVFEKYGYTVFAN